MLTSLPIGGKPRPGAMLNLNFCNKLVKNKKYSFSANDCPRQNLLPIITSQVLHSILLQQSDLEWRPSGEGGGDGRDSAGSEREHVDRRALQLQALKIFNFFSGVPPHRSVAQIENQQHTIFLVPKKSSQKK